MNTAPVTADRQLDTYVDHDGEEREVPQSDTMECYFNRFTLTLPTECVYDCSRPGQSADDAVAYWASRIPDSQRPEADAVREELKEYGAWDTEELADDSGNWERLIWIASCNIREEPES